MTSSDQTVANQYSYDANGNVVCVADLRNNTTTKRSYDAWNRILTEQLANGHCLHVSLKSACVSLLFFSRIRSALSSPDFRAMVVSLP